MEGSESRHWYAIRVKTRWEKATRDILTAKGVTCFLPTYEARRKWSDRFKVVELPLFAGYLFCQLSTSDFHRTLTSAGVVHIVGFGKSPAQVDDGEIEAIQRVVASRVGASPWPYLRSGDNVQIMEGPLRGLSGIVVRHQKPERLIVSVSLLQRSVAVELDAAWLRQEQCPARIGVAGARLATVSAKIA